MKVSALPVSLSLQVERRARLLGDGARCSSCAIADPVVLVSGSSPLVCRRCELRRREGRESELHHLGGRPSPFVVWVDANVHAWLTLYQSCWRDWYAPGSTPAVLIDLLALAIVVLRGGCSGQAA